MNKQQLAEVIYTAVEQGWVDEDMGASSIPTPWKDTPSRERRVFTKAARAVLVAILETMPIPGDETPAAFVVRFAAWRATLNSGSQNG